MKPEGSLKRFARCRCPECAALDRAFPGHGAQLALPLIRRPFSPPQHMRRNPRIARMTDRPTP